MASVGTVDSENRLLPPDDARDWFPPGARFLIEKWGDTVMLKPIGGLGDHLDKVQATDNDDEMSWSEIDSEVQASRREKAGRSTG